MARNRNPLKRAPRAGGCYEESGVPMEPEAFARSWEVSGSDSDTWLTCSLLGARHPSCLPFLVPQVLLLVPVRG